MSGPVSKHLIHARLMVATSRDYWQTAEILPKYPPTTCKRMARCTPQDPRTREERFAFNPLAGSFIGAHRQVNVAICDVIYQLVDTGIDQPYDDLRLLAPVVGDGNWQCRTRQDERCANTDDASCAVANIACGLFGRMQVAKYGFGRRQEVSARRRKIHAPCRAIEKPKAEFAL